jgi:hypothetical protein
LRVVSLSQAHILTPHAHRTQELKQELVKLGETTIPSWVSEKSELVTTTTNDTLQRHALNTTNIAMTSLQDYNNSHDHIETTGEDGQGRGGARG